MTKYLIPKRYMRSRYGQLTELMKRLDERGEHVCYRTVRRALRFETDDHRARMIRQVAESLGIRVARPSVLRDEEGNVVVVYE